MEIITDHFEHPRARINGSNDRDKWATLTRIVCGMKQFTLGQFTCAFNGEDTRHISDNSVSVLKFLLDL